MQRSLRVLFVLLLACAVSSAAPAFAQQQITGTVTDAQTGESLPGASVSVPGTTTGTATDIDGQYELTVGAEVDSLRFSFVGYSAQTVAIAGRSTIDVALSSATQQLDDIVVIGYGAVEERDVTGSVEKVNAADFNPSAGVSPEQLISGKVAGVQISTTDGAPGGDSFIRIRGATSVNASSQPLFVVDGVPIDNEGAQAQRNPLNFLNRNEIESITVLKDASATAIYGTRGANGVVIIETKGADSGEARVTYSGSVSASNTVQNTDILGPQRFRQVVADRTPSRVSELGDAETDWQDAIERTAIGQEHNLSMSRGYEDATIRFSLGYLDQEGVLQQSATRRLSTGLKYTQSLFDDQLQLRANVKGAKTEDDFEPGGMVGGAASFAPTQPIRDFTSPFGGFFEWGGSNLAEDNPVAQYVLSRNVGTAFRTLGNVEAEYELPYLTGLSARVNLGWDVSTGEREAFQPTFLKAQAEQGEERAGVVERFSFTRTNRLLDAYLNYDRRFEEIDSKFDVTAGYSFQDFDEEYPEFTANGLSTNAFGENATPVTNTEFSTTALNELQNRLVSVFGRINYTYLDRYLLTATVRRDGSSRFGPDRRYGTFPSAALAWRAHQEPFLQNIDAFANVVSNLKVRLSYGETGNQNFGDFLYKRFYTPGGPQAQAQFGAGEDAEFINTVRPSAADQTLGWERTRMYTAALDIGIYDDRFNASVELYDSVTDDLLFNVQLPGFIQPGDFAVTNIGSVENRGVEVALDGDVIRTEAFTWNASFTGAYNQNEITKVRGEPGDFELVGGISGGIGNNVQIIREGDAIRSFFLFEHKLDENGDPLVDGVDHNGDGTANRLDYYVDRNGDGEINTDDRYIAGSPQPDWVLGHTSQFRYQDFDLSFTIRANLGHQVYNNVASNFGNYSRISPGSPALSNLHVSALENNFENGLYLSDVYVEDADFLRMDNITLGYTTNVIPYVNSVRIYGSVSNPFVLTGYSGVDPEVGGDDSRGIDNNIYPRSRTFTTGISVSL
jgi:iron complex outermembrane receptor protein